MTLLQESFRYQVKEIGSCIYSNYIIFVSFSTILGVSFYAKPNLAFYMIGHGLPHLKKSI